MSYVKYIGKMVQYNGKYVGKIAQITPLFSGWTNSTWDTFTSSGLNVLSAIEANGTKGEADTELKAFEVGDQIKIEYNITLNAGTYPTNTAEIHLVHEYMGIVGTATLMPGGNYVTGLTVGTQPGSMNFKLRFQNYNKITGNSCNCSCQLMITKP